MDKYTSYVSERKVETIKLIYAGEGDGIKADCDDTLIFNSYSKFSIQPTIIRKDILLTTVSGVAYSTVNYYADGRNGDTDTGIITADSPWTGMFTNTGTNGNGIGILSGTGLFVSKSTLPGYESYYFFGLKK